MRATTTWVWCPAAPAPSTADVDAADVATCRECGATDHDRQSADGTFVPDPVAKFAEILAASGYVLTERFSNSPRFDLEPDRAIGELAVDVRHVEVGARAYSAGEFYRDADRFYR